MDPRALRIIAIIGFVVMLIGGFWTVANIYYFWGMQTVEGKVVSNVSSKTSSVAAVLVGYDVGGRAYTIQVDARYGKRGKSLRMIGEPISVSYNPKNPSEAREFNVVLAYVIPGLLMFSGLTTILTFRWLGMQVVAQSERPSNI
ncbi:MAG: DUF3592 domain-containing protein [Patescibacteria group bacterium]